MKRIAELDAIRGIAALVIMINHLPYQGWIFRLGAYGVDLFFVLSGYLITTIILKNADTPRFMIAFYARRSLRIWPIYYLVLLLVIVVNPFLKTPQPMNAWPYYAVYLQNLPKYWFGEMPPFTTVLDHTWTLALEEQYYLIWPALVVLFGRRSVVPLALLFCATSFWSVSYGFSNRLLLSRSEGFALGGILAVVFRDVETARARSKRSLIGLAVLTLAAVSYPAWGGGFARLVVGFRPSFRAEDVATSIRLMAVAVAFTGLVGAILVLQGRPILKPLRDPRLCYLGQISYGVYLYHIPIYHIFDNVTGCGSTWWGVAVKMAAGIAVAAASWELLERPILRLKHRFRYQAEVAR